MSGLRLFIAGAGLVAAGCGQMATASVTGETTAPVSTSTSTTMPPKVNCFGEQAGTDSTVLELLSQRGQNVSRLAPPYSDLSGAMPDVEYVVEGKTVWPSDLVVAGPVTKVEPGASFLWTSDDDGDGSETRVELPFNDESAMASTIHVTIDVESSRSREASPETVVVGLGLGSHIDVDAAEADLMKLDGVVAVVQGDSAVYDYDESLWAVVEGPFGVLLGVVASNNCVRFPAADFGFIGPGITLEQLMSLQPPDTPSVSASPTTTSVETTTTAHSQPETDLGVSFQRVHGVLTSGDGVFLSEQFTVDAESCSTEGSVDIFSWIDGAVGAVPGDRLGQVVALDGRASITSACDFTQFLSHALWDGGHLTDVQTAELALDYMPGLVPSDGNVQVFDRSLSVSMPGTDGAELRRESFVHSEGIGCEGEPVVGYIVHGGTAGGDWWKQPEPPLASTDESGRLFALSATFPIFDGESQTFALIDGSCSEALSGLRYGTYGEDGSLIDATWAELPTTFERPSNVNEGFRGLDAVSIHADGTVTAWIANGETVLSHSFPPSPG